MSRIDWGAGLKTQSLANGRLGPSKALKVRAMKGKGLIVVVRSDRALSQCFQWQPGSSVMDMTLIGCTHIATDKQNMEGRQMCKSF